MLSLILWNLQRCNLIRTYAIYAYKCWGEHINISNRTNKYCMLSQSSGTHQKCAANCVWTTYVLVFFALQGPTAPAWLRMKKASKNEHLAGRSGKRVRNFMFLWIWAEKLKGCWDFKLIKIQKRIMFYIFIIVCCIYYTCFHSCSKCPIISFLLLFLDYSCSIQEWMLRHIFIYLKKKIWNYISELF